MNRPWLLLSFAVLTLEMSFALPSLGQAPANTATSAQKEQIASAGKKGSITLVCNAERPSQVQRFLLSCPGSTQVDVAVADCCLPGDHWQVKLKSWDLAPNTSVETSPGGASIFGTPARVYNYGGPASNKTLVALIECSYLHGINVFPAGAFLSVYGDGGICSSTDLGSVDQIDRTP